MDLNDLAFFVHAADRGGFTAAAAALGVSKSTVSQRIARLEDSLGARLIERSSRRFVVTDIGRDLHRHASAMLIQAEAAESAVRERIGEPRGVVRLTCSIGMAQDIAPLLARFLARFPKVDVVQHATNRFVDLLAEGFDIGLRGHDSPLADSDLIQRRVARTPWALVAAPDYLERAGTPKRPEDLASHGCLAPLGPPGEPTWRLYHVERGERRVDTDPRLASDDLDTLRDAAVAGLGIAALPAYQCRSRLDSGLLRVVLPGWSTGDAQVSLLTLPRRAQLPAVGALADYLLSEYAPLLDPPM